VGFSTGIYAQLYSTNCKLGPKPGVYRPIMNALADISDTLYGADLI